MKMLLIPILLMLIVVKAEAQTETRWHEVALSYGIAPLTEFGSDDMELEVSDMWGMYVNTRDEKYSEAIGLQYAYQPVRWFELGVVGCFNRITMKVYPYIDSTYNYVSENAKGDASYNYLTIMYIYAIIFAIQRGNLNGKH